MCQRWRLFFKPIHAHPETVVAAVKTACILHNFLCHQNDSSYAPRGFGDIPLAGGEVIEGEWRRCGTGNGMVHQGVLNGNNSATSGIIIRDKFASYFSGAGSVS